MIDSWVYGWEPDAAASLQGRYRKILVETGVTSFY